VERREFTPRSALRVWGKSRNGLLEGWIDLEDATLTEQLTNLTLDVVINTGDGDGGVAVARSGRP
jgi:hypothetical protein